MKSRKLTWIVVLFVAAIVQAKDKKQKSSFTPVERYISAYTGDPLAVNERPSGSLFQAGSNFSDIAADPRAQRVNDIITIRVMEETLAQSSADVSAARKLNAQSGISSFVGRVDTTGVSSLFSPQSTQSLTGKGQSNSQSRLRTSVAGRIAAVLPNGVMVVEAERKVRMNNEAQTILLRGMLRPADVLSDNTALSTSLANLEIELKGKGVVSDATRPPNRLVRALLWLAGF
jgi:flagellar L-ring protein FlgH